MRQRLFGGRIRTSTALLVLLFVATLVLYLLVRPVPASVADSSPATPRRTQPTATSTPSVRTTAPSSAPARSTEPASPSPSPASPSPRPASTPAPAPTVSPEP